MEKVKYYIGLDIGTSSIGWSVTDEKNNLLKFKGKNMWGVRLFEEGKTAKARRIFRSTRRRHDRRRYRLSLFRKIIEPELLKIDPSFFIRLEESFLHQEDRKNSGFNKYNLFIEEGFDDVEYYKRYPTIYHLRKHLIVSKEKEDIRLIYLALHHILKYRGNFIYENQDFNVDNINLEAQLKETLSLLDELIYLEKLDNVDINQITSLLKRKDLKKTEKKEKIVSLLNELFTDKKQLEEFTKLVIGLKSKANLLFPNVEFDIESEKILNISFETSQYDDSKDEIDEILDDKSFVLEKIKELYNGIFLSSLFDNSKTKYISDIMVKKHEDHGNDLKLLRNLFRENYSHKSENDYERIFKSKLIGKNYRTFIRNPKQCSYEDLLKEIKKVLVAKPLIGNKEYDECMEKVEKETLLPRINTVSNSIYPYQLNLVELEKIIENQVEYYPLLGEKTEDGKNKIIELFKFKIPYYVGPLNRNINNKNSFAWIEKYSNEEITPWNFHDVVNVELSAEKFITRMTNFCTYLINETVIPKNSLLYTKFMVLNELKQIKINGKKLPLELEQKIVTDLFINNQKTKVTKSDLERWLKKNKEYSDIDLEITGFSRENEFANNLKPYIDFIKIFGEINNQNNLMIEEIINWLTIYEDKAIVANRIEKTYKDVTEEQIKKIVNLKYTGWSRLSKKLLEDNLLFDKRTGGVFSIIKLLETTKENFMQIISNKYYNFDEMIEKENFGDLNKEISYEEIKALVCSPAIKKGIWQSILIVKEIIEIMKDKPEHIFIEMARGDREKVRTKSRKEQLKELYEKMSGEYSKFGISKAERKDLIKQINDNENNLAQMKYFLYFLQQGKCLYCGESLNIYDLRNCEIDHIIPRTIIKDDSIDNLALVNKSCNQWKFDNLTLSRTTISNQKPIWNYLFKNKFISLKKYNNLIRDEFKEDDINGFINRQLVETRQITKHVANLINGWLGNDVVFTIKAKFITDFRNKYEIYKIRELNNLHHAQDAYLCSCIGNYILKRYNNFKNEFIFSKYLKYNSSWSNRGYGFIINNMDNDYVKEDDKIQINAEDWIQRIIKISSYQDMIVTKKVEKMSGEFYNQNALPKGKNLIPLKKNLDPIKYGGYSGKNESYYILIKYYKGKKEVKKMIGIPIVIDQLSKKEPNRVLEYIKNVEGITNFEIVRNNICKNQMIEYNGQNCFIASSRELCNAVELKLNRKVIKYLYILTNKYLSEEEINIFKANENEVIYEIIDKMKKHYPMFENECIKITDYVNRGYFNDLSIEDKKTFVFEMFRILNAGSINGNLEKFSRDEIKFGNRIGRLNEKNINNGYFIDNSITGLYRRKYEL